MHEERSAQIPEPRVQFSKSRVFIVAICLKVVSRGVDEGEGKVNEINARNRVSVVLNCDSVWLVFNAIIR